MHAVIGTTGFSDAQKAQIKAHAEHIAFAGEFEERFTKVKALVGQKIKVKGSLDAATGTITVDSATKSSS